MPSLLSLKEPRSLHISMALTSAAPTQLQLTELRDAAAAVAHNAYAPYSRFRVGAALLLAGTGAIVTGCNVENASFRLTTCAEQAAVAQAVARHGPGIRILAVAVVNLNDSASQPCGACRQTLLEFSLPETVVLYPGADRRFEQQLLSGLLPASFALDHA